MYLALDSKNSKIVGEPRRGFAATLTLPIASTCPESCTMKASGECYAQGGRMAIHVRNLETQTKGRPALAIARDAAKEIQAAAPLSLGRPLRLFAAGDARTEAMAKVIAASARMWKAPVWGYTHASRVVPRDAWRGVSILASVDSPEDAKRALTAGYAPAIVRPEHPADGRTYRADGVNWIPCPEQTRGVPCVACGLCFDSERLQSRGMGIAFAAHGTKANALKRRLRQLPLFNGTGKERAA